MLRLARHACTSAPADPVHVLAAAQHIVGTQARISKDSMSNTGGLVRPVCSSCYILSWELQAAGTTLTALLCLLLVVQTVVQIVSAVEAANGLRQA